MPIDWNAELNKRFSYHPPKASQPARYEEIRGQARQLAYMLIHDCPESRELSLALTHLEDCVMWANAAIARNESQAEGSSSPASTYTEQLRQADEAWARNLLDEE